VNGACSLGFESLQTGSKVTPAALISDRIMLSAISPLSYAVHRPLGFIFSINRDPKALV
jgi:hypothetical protein